MPYSKTYVVSGPVRLHRSKHHAIFLHGCGYAQPRVGETIILSALEMFLLQIESKVLWDPWGSDIISLTHTVNNKINARIFHVYFFQVFPNALFFPFDWRMELFTYSHFILFPQIWLSVVTNADLSVDASFHSMWCSSDFHSICRFDFQDASGF